MSGLSGKERREYLRYRYDKPMKYNVVDMSKDSHPVSSIAKAVSKNLSASGILFSANVKSSPKLGDVLVLELDYRTAIICSEVEEHALILDNKLIGKVVRLEENSDGTFDVGVAFFTKTDPLSRDAVKVEDILSRL